MGAFAGRQDNWDSFEEKWAKVCGRVPELKGGALHGKDLIPKHGIYRNWPDEIHLIFLGLLAKIMRDSGIYGMAATVSNDDYAAIRNEFKGARARLDSAYGMCFRACMARLAAKANEEYPDQQISFVVESGHRNCGDAERIFNHTKNQKVSLVRYNLGNFAEAAKADYGALQAADLIAYSAHTHMEEYFRTGSSVVVGPRAILLSVVKDLPWITKDQLEWQLGMTKRLLDARGTKFRKEPKAPRQSREIPLSLESEPKDNGTSTKRQGPLHQDDEGTVSGA